MCFGLSDLVDGDDCLICIPTGAINKFGNPKCYKFYPEDLFCIL